MGSDVCKRFFLWQALMFGNISSNGVLMSGRFLLLQALIFGNISFAGPDVL